MVYNHNIGQTRKVQVTGDNRMVPDACRCENDGICDSAPESFTFISTGEDRNVPAHRYNHTPDPNLMDNTLYSMRRFCLVQEFYHFREGQH